MKKTTLSILIGSGFSCAAGMASVGDLTNKILTASPNEFSSLSDHQLSQDFPVAEIQPYLAYLQSCLPETKNLHYEELFYLNNLILRVLQGNKVDFTEKYIVDTARAKAPKLPPWRHYKDLVQETERWMRLVVANMLSKQGDLTVYTDFLNTLPFDKHQIKFFTLNHDLLLQQALHSLGITYDDGFNKTISDSNIYHGGTAGFSETFYRHVYTGFSSNFNHQVIALHGSVDWLFIRPSNNIKKASFFDAKGKIVSNELLKNSEMGRVTTLSRDGAWLMGTANKIKEYSFKRVYADMHLKFAQDLKSTNHLYIVGYGFGDEGINEAIKYGFSNEAPQFSPERMVIVDYNKTISDFRTSNGRIFAPFDVKSFEDAMDHLRFRNRLAVLTQSAEKTTYSQLLETVNKLTGIADD